MTRDKLRILQIHQDVILEFGGSDGLLNPKIIDDIPGILNPPSGVEISELDIIIKISYKIIHDHPFVDGNKRTGYLVLSTYLDDLGIDINISKLTDLVLKIASGHLTLAEYIDKVHKLINRL